MQQFVSLMYHNVYDNEAAFRHLSPSITSYFVDRKTFAAQIEELCALSTCLDVVAMTRLYGSTTPKTSDATYQHRQVQITFDDGWLGSVELAGPVLEKHNCRAILFVTTDLVDQPLFLNRKDIQNLSTETFQIGSHARTHRMLNRLEDKAIREELLSSKQFLEDVVGYEVDALSIPGGAVDKRVRRIAIETGYRYLFTSEVHINTARTGPTNIGRVPIRRNTSLTDFRRYVCHKISREQLRQQVLQIPKQLLGPDSYASLRGWVLGETNDQQEMLTLARSENNQ